MNEKKFIRAGLFYGAIMTISICQMHAAIKKMESKVDSVYHACDEYMDIYENDLIQINKVLKQQKKWNKDVATAVNELIKRTKK